MRSAFREWLFSRRYVFTADPDIRLTYLVKNCLMIQDVMVALNTTCSFSFRILCDLKACLIFRIVDKKWFNLQVSTRIGTKVGSDPICLKLESWYLLVLFSYVAFLFFSKKGLFCYTWIPVVLVLLDYNELMHKICSCLHVRTHCFSIWLALKASLMSPPSMFKGSTSGDSHATLIRRWWFS